ncbi:hypothetical protein FRX31_024374 [Thalictrum thalictroides]|uniref:Uncharacterized protein n=1 Tax=Thalictrum thalictroides TaxID=46969 RepID=A0A7J6VN33_THATH|nr:hypothetical protein FRX31_024374 [Thalictrum thalictroides]
MRNCPERVGEHWVQKTTTTPQVEKENIDSATSKQASPKQNRSQSEVEKGDEASSSNRYEVLREEVERVQTMNEAKESTEEIISSLGKDIVVVEEVEEVVPCSIE